MLYLKKNPIGIDGVIDRIQSTLFRRLCKRWSIEESEYDSYCRAYKNQTKNGYVPEFYIGNKEYKELFVNDTISATSFFLSGDKVKKVGSGFQSELSVIFFVDISKLKNISHRADDEVRNDVIQSLPDFNELISVETGINNVFREFSQSSIKFRDMHPLHCFRLNLIVNYTMC